MEILLHLASMILAMAATVGALHLIRFTGHTHAWLFLAFGVLLLAAERVLELWTGSMQGYSLHELASDVLMFVMAVIFLMGIHRMRAVFLEHRATQEVLQHELEELRRFQRVTVGRELRMKQLVEENTVLHRQLDDAHQEGAHS